MYSIWAGWFLVALLWLCIFDDQIQTFWNRHCAKFDTVDSDIYVTRFVHFSDPTYRTCHVSRPKALSLWDLSMCQEVSPVIVFFSLCVALPNFFAQCMLTVEASSAPTRSDRSTCCRPLFHLLREKKQECSFFHKCQNVWKAISNEWQSNGWGQRGPSVKCWTELRQTAS